MVKYLSGRVKRTPQDQLKEDRFRYLNLEQAEPNLADPPTSNVPTGQQFQLIAIPGHPGKRYWVPTGGGLIPGAITIFDENVQVSAADSITQVNFEGKAVTADVSVQSPSGHPGFAATVTVIPVTVGDNPPNTPTPRNGELWWESDTGDLYVYYEDVNSSQWVQANAGGRGDDGDKGDKGEPSTVQGPQGIQGVEGEKGAPGNVLAKGVKGEPGTSIKGEPGASIKGEPGASIKGEPGNDIKGDKGDQGDQGDKAGILFKFSNATSMVDPNPGNFRFNSTSLSSVSAIAIDALDSNSNDFSDFLTTWDDSTNTVKGTLEIKSNLNTDTTHAVFQITSITDNVGWLQIGVQNPVGNIPSNLEVCVLNFSRAGDKGQKGEVNVAAAGANTQVQFNDNGSFAGADNLQFIKSNTDPKLLLKPSDTSTNTNGGSLTVQNANDSNHSQLSSDGALELKRTNETATTGGPYIDFKSVGTNNDARIEIDIASGQQNDADYSSIAFKTGGSGSVSERFRIGKVGQIGLSGANYGNANQVLTSKGSSSAVEWTTQLNDNTTYTLPDTGTDGTNFTTARGSATITLTGTDSSTDAVVITAGDNVKITDTGSGGFTINAQNTEGPNTTYTLPDTGTDGTNFTNARGSATITLTGSDSSTDAVVITAGDNIKITNTGSGGFTINAQNTEGVNTTYTLPAGGTDSTDFGNGNATITLTGTDSTTDPVTISAGTNVKITGTSATGFTISAKDTNTQIPDTTYDLLAVQTNGNNNDPAIKLDASSGDDDEVKLVGVDHSGITVTRADDSTINFDTSLQFLARQSTSGSDANPNLDLMGSASVALDTVKLVGGTNVNIERNSSGNEITFTAQNDNTQLSKETVQDYIGEMLSGNTETRISVTYDDANNKINFVVDDQSSDNNTTYDLITSSSGNNVNLKLDASSGDDDTILLTAGTNVSFTSVSSTGFTINTSSTLSGTIDEADKVKVNTSNENEYHNIAFVPKDTTSGSYQTLEIDSTDQRLAWNPNNNRLQSYDTQTYRLLTWSAGSAGTAGQVLTSGGTGGWTWTTPSNLSGINAGASISSSPPSSPQDGALWWDKDDGDLHIYYDDGSGSPSAQWVSIGASGQKGEKGDQGQSGTMTVNARTSGYSAVASDNGKLITMTTGDLTISSNVFSAGDAVTVANLSNSAFSILQGSGVLLYLTGTTVTGNRSLAAKGLCTLVCVSANTFFVSGGGVT